MGQGLLGDANSEDEVSAVDELLSDEEGDGDGDDHDPEDGSEAGSTRVGPRPAAGKQPSPRSWLAKARRLGRRLGFGSCSRRAPCNTPVPAACSSGRAV